MGISPWKVGASLPVWVITLQQRADDGTVTPLVLTGATVTVKFALTTATAWTQGANPVTITDAANGVVSYQVAVTDPIYLAAGQYIREFVATFAGGVAKTDSKPLLVNPSP